MDWENSEKYLYALQVVHSFQIWRVRLYTDKNIVHLPEILFAPI